ncbi:MAG: ABC transporter substrate-binding protein [Candidatus Limnocylindrus sp.]
MSPLRRVAALLLFAVAFLSAGAQAGVIGGGRPGGGLSIGITLPNGPTTLREGVIGLPERPLPLFASTGADRAIVALTYRGLTRLDTSGYPTADLATSWSVSEDGLAWTFVLDPVARWEDGTQVTAADAQLTIGLAGELQLDGGYWEALTVEVSESSSNLVIRAPRALANLPALLGTLPLLPAHLFSGTAARDIPQLEAATTPMGSGPFRVIEMDGGAAALEVRDDPLASDLEARSLIRDGATGLAADSVALRFYGTEEEGLNAWRAGDLDALVGVGREGRVSAGLTAARTIELGSTTFNGIAVNLRPRAILRHPKLRLGLRALLNPSEITAAFGGREVSAPVSPLSWGWAEVPLPVRGIEYATKQFEGAKWRFKDGVWVDAEKKPVSLEILTLPAGPYPDDAAVARQAAAAWIAFGVPTIVTEVDAETLTTRLATGEFDLVVLNVDVGIDPDLYPLLGSAAVLSGGNVVGIQLKDLDALLNEARKPTERAARAKALAAVQRWCAANNYLLPIRFKAEELLVSPRLTGLVPLLVREPETHLRDVLSFRLAAP